MSIHLLCKLHTHKKNVTSFIFADPSNRRLFWLKYMLLGKTCGGSSDQISIKLHMRKINKLQSKLNMELLLSESEVVEKIEIHP